MKYQNIKAPIFIRMGCLILCVALHHRHNGKHDLEVFISIPIFTKCCKYYSDLVPPHVGDLTPVTYLNCGEQAEK